MTASCLRAKIPSNNMKNIETYFANLKRDLLLESKKKKKNSEE